MRQAIVALLPTHLTHQIPSSHRLSAAQQAPPAAAGGCLHAQPIIDNPTQPFGPPHVRCLHHAAQPPHSTPGTMLVSADPASIPRTLHFIISSSFASPNMAGFGADVPPPLTEDRRAASTAATDTRAEGPRQGGGGSSSGGPPEGGPHHVSPSFNAALARVEAAGQLSAQGVEHLAHWLAVTMQGEAGLLLGTSSPATPRFAAALLKLGTLAADAGGSEGGDQEGAGSHGGCAAAVHGGSGGVRQDVAWLAEQLADGDAGHLPWLSLLLQQVATHPHSPALLSALASAAAAPAAAQPDPVANPTLGQLLIDMVHTLAAPTADISARFDSVGAGTASWDAEDLAHMPAPPASASGAAGLVGSRGILGGAGTEPAGAAASQGSGALEAMHFDLDNFAVRYEQLFGRPPSRYTLRAAQQHVYTSSQAVGKVARLSILAMMQKVIALHELLGGHTAHIAISHHPQSMLLHTPFAKIQRNVGLLNAELCAFAQQHPGLVASRRYKPRRWTQSMLTVDEHDEARLSHGLMRKCALPVDASPPAQALLPVPLNLDVAAVRRQYQDTLPLTLEIINKRCEILCRNLHKSKYEEGWLQKRLSRLEATLKLPTPLVWNIIRTLPWVLTVTDVHIEHMCTLLSSWVTSELRTLAMQPAAATGNCGDVTGGSECSSGGGGGGGSRSSSSSSSNCTGVCGSENRGGLGATSKATTRRGKSFAKDSELNRLGMPQPRLGACIGPADSADPEHQARLRATEQFVGVVFVRRPILLKFSLSVQQAKLMLLHDLAACHEVWRQDLLAMLPSNLASCLAASTQRYHRIRYMQECTQKHGFPHQAAGVSIEKILKLTPHDFHAMYPNFAEWVDAAYVTQ